MGRSKRCSLARRRVPAVSGSQPPASARLAARKQVCRALVYERRLGGPGCRMCIWSGVSLPGVPRLAPVQSAGSRSVAGWSCPGVAAGEPRTHQQDPWEARRRMHMAPGRPHGLSAGAEKLGTQHKQGLTAIIAWRFHVKHSLAKIHLRTAGLVLHTGVAPSRSHHRTNSRADPEGGPLEPAADRSIVESGGHRRPQAHRVRRTLHSVLCGGGPSPGQ